MRLRALVSCGPEMRQLGASFITNPVGCVIRFYVDDRVVVPTRNWRTSGMRLLWENSK
jgi:hypothetical protein